MLEGKFSKARIKAGNPSTSNIFRQPLVNLDYRVRKGLGIQPKADQRAVFLTLKEAGTLPPARPMKPKTTETRRNRGYCEYHQDQDHITEHCMHLSRAIDQVASGKREEPPKPPRMNQEFLIQKARENQSQEDEGIEHTVFVIMGGEYNETKESKKISHADGTINSLTKTWRVSRLHTMTH